jgi:hypothetical protein
MSTTNCPVVIYGNGLFQDGYPSPPVAYPTQAEQLKKGITSVLLWSIHIHEGGDFYLNDTPFVIDGKVVYSTDPTKGINPDFPTLVSELMHGGTVRELLISVGAWGTTSDFYNWYAARNAVKANLALLKSTFGIAGVDFDYEGDYTQGDGNKIVDLTLDVASVGLFATYCPYMESSWWIGCLQNVYKQNNQNQPVHWFNLQCYAGGSGNNPVEWAQAVAAAPGTGVTDANAFIVPGFGVYPDGLTPAQLQSTFSAFKGSGIISGFLWNSGAIWQGESSNPSYTPNAYATAIAQGLG